MKVLVLQHAVIETPGVLTSYMTSSGDEIITISTYLGEDIPDLDRFDLMIVMGGVQDVWQEDEFPWLQREKRAIRDFVLAMERPFLGICLGHQLLVAATGGKVEPAKQSELGLLTVAQTEQGLRDPVFRGIPPEIDVIQWHGAEATALPEGAQVLASSPVCRAQCVRIGHRGYGFQWHIEADVRTVSDWAAEPSYAEHLESNFPGGADKLRVDVSGKMNNLDTVSKAVYRNLRSLC